MLAIYKGLKIFLYFSHIYGDIGIVAICTAFWNVQSAFWGGQTA